MHVIVWEFRIAAEHREAFERAYGPHGDWVRLFRSAPGYLGTELLHDETDANRYLTIDRWQSDEDFETFKRASHVAYDALDRGFAELIVQEMKIGTFNMNT